jgi:dihydrofolate synthase/folylpolyglutamate synthase
MSNAEASRPVERDNGSAAILERFRVDYGKDMDLTLRPAYHVLLDKLGNPHRRLPPVFHVAGTNGKGSTCAFLRAILEAAGYKVHVYTSPHLVRFHERIRLAGELIIEEELAEILATCEELAEPGGVSYFEAATAAAFVAFARHPADFVILEVGLGGRLDATNVIDKPLATLITRLSFDHRDYLGDTIEAIAREKAGIMRNGVPCFTMAQPDAGALQALRDAAFAVGAPLFVEGADWTIEPQKFGFKFADTGKMETKRAFNLPPPELAGRHQFHNAALAVAALSRVPQDLLPPHTVVEGLQRVDWPARLQLLTLGGGGGSLTALLAKGAELWLDGGHNDSAGAALAAQIDQWRLSDGANPRPFYVICGMLTTKVPAEFLGPFAKYVNAFCAVPVPDPLAMPPEMLASEARKLGIGDVTAGDVRSALSGWAAGRSARPAEGSQPAPSLRPRVLICGSLYLAGHVLSLPPR